MILLNTDFKGYWNLSQNKFSLQDIDRDIAMYEKLYMCYIFGQDLSNLFYADLDVNNMPQSQRFIDIYNALCVGQYDCLCGNSTHQESLGLKETLMGFVYYYHVINSQFKHTIAGTVVNQNEISSAVPNYDLHSIAEHRYNSSVKWSKAIQAFIKKNISVYPEYAGVCLDYKFNNLF